MKANTLKVLIISLVLTTSLSCRKDNSITPIEAEKPSTEEFNCEKFNCKDAKVVQTLANIEAKVIQIQDVYCLTIDPTDFEIDGFKINGENILVLCQELHSDLQKINQRVIVSGQKMDCCELLTLPYLRVSFGCLFKISSIKAK
jgi:hypothetical protein